MADMKKLKHLFQDAESYSLKIVTEWLKEKNIPFKYSDQSLLSDCLYNTGVMIDIGETKISIQTHPVIAGWAFAETLMKNDMLSDVRHKNPEDLFSYLSKLIV